MKKKFENIDKLKNSLSKIADRPTQIKILAEYLLDYLEATTVGTSKSSLEIWEAYKELRDNHPEFIPIIPENTFIVLLSRISGEQGSRINCPGKKQGYYLEQLVEKIEKLDEQNITQENQTVDNFTLSKERDLYPILKEWLFEKDFDRVAITSDLKSNGKWGNPDIVGLNIEDIYGRPEVEIATIELKLTDDMWEKWIFESIAHTRFSNRSYFAFLYPDNLINKLDSSELKLYAEHFKIGILILEIKGEDYLMIKERKPANINLKEIRVTEYCQAPFNQTHIKFRKKFLESLDILELNKLYRFGEELE